MSADLNRWLLVVVLILCVLGLILFARGAVHHRGEEVGARTTVSQEVGR